MPATPSFTKASDYTLKNFENCIFGHDFKSSTKPMALINPNSYNWEFLTDGTAQGRLCGGNLTMLVSSLGTPYEIDTCDKIVFIEEVNEEPYKVDRMLNQLRLAGKFKSCAGVVFGDFADCSSINIREIILGLGLKVPILYNFKCGHCEPTASLPLGATVCLDSKNNEFYIKFFK